MTFDKKYWCLTFCFYCIFTFVQITYKDKEKEVWNSARWNWIWKPGLLLIISVSIATSVSLSLFWYTYEQEYGIWTFGFFWYPNG